MQPTQSTNAPTRERRQHGDRIILAERQILDSYGSIGLPHVVETPIARLYRMGEITDTQLDAAIEFRRLHRLAFLDPLRAATIDGLSIRATRLPHGSEDARRTINAALRALGSHHGSLLASCADSVIGSETALSAWALSQRWGGRNINNHVAKGILLATLEMLPDILRRSQKNA